MPSLFWAKAGKQSSIISVEWNQTLDIHLKKKLKCIFMTAFLRAHQNIPDRELGISKIKKEAWLEELFSKEIKILEKERGISSFATILVNDVTVGFVTCRLQSNKEIYIKFLAIKPFQPIKSNKKEGALGLGRIAIESIESRFPDFESITLETHRTNRNAQGFYEHLGFKRTDPPCGDEKNYIGYRKPISVPLLIDQIKLLP
ncbi:TPA: GNAT family N-acetyltransferase [Legionella pneumophila]